MKKILISLLMVSLMTSISFAQCSSDDLSCKKPCEKEDILKDKCNDIVKESDKCDKCSIEDDEYCVYNQCFFDKKFKKLKKELCLTKKQECQIDNLYKNLKTDMENLHYKYRCEKSKLLTMIECNDGCYREQLKKVKDIKKEFKERCKCFRQDVKEILCSSQIKTFNRYQRCERRKMKKIIKYSKVYKFPCDNCCK